MRIQTIAPLFVAISLLGCDLGSSSDTTMREKIADALARADISLAQAVSTAVAETGGVAIDAELDVENQTPVFDVEVFVDGGLREVDVDIEDGSVVRNRASSSGNEEDNAANAQFATGVDWSVLIAAAEAEVGGTAFEIKADDGELEVEVLAGDTVFEVELAADGSILKVEQSDDDGVDDDDDGDEDEDDDHHGGDDDDGSDDDDGGSDDDDGGSDDDDGGSDDDPSGGSN
jgi:uncharacterized membrane protein YkoI